MGTERAEVAAETLEKCGQDGRGGKGRPHWGRDATIKKKGGNPGRRGHRRPQRERTGSQRSNAGKTKREDRKTPSWIYDRCDGGFEYSFVAEDTELTP
jgi:hypothetical protein